MEIYKDYIHKPISVLIESLIELENDYEELSKSLEETVIRMKNCYNCKYFKSSFDGVVDCDFPNCNSLDKWEID